jgi:2,3,4,5-tetrahydropyridine-2-carboxylate N-succinyltransferase
MDTAKLKALIERAYADRTELQSAPVRAAIDSVMAQLDAGKLRVAQFDPEARAWVTHAWLKQAILLYFAVAEMQVHEVGPFEFYDKIPLKTRLHSQGVRVVPPGVVRYGAHLERGTVVMPAYVNIGAYVGAGTMVDTWATVGSCAQVGKNVHLSGGVGIGGVLEPPQAAPVIIEDDAFIGSRCVVVEGVHVGQGAVLGAGVVLTASTPIIDVRGQEEIVTRGHVPSRCVVIPGVRQKTFPAGTYGLPCALIVGERSAKTDEKTSLNQALRDFEVAV